MPSFKHKPEKKIKINKKYNVTLDGKHKECINEFNRDKYDIIPNLKKEKQLLENRLKQHQNQ